jgi:hypothetical protein
MNNHSATTPPNEMELPTLTLNVLVFHRMGDPKNRLEAVRALEFMIPENRRDLNCIVHDADLPFPAFLKKIQYHLIVLGPTFLWSRNSAKDYKKILNTYDFVGESTACKVALPQDEYDGSAILDNWMVRWNVDRIYSVCPQEHWQTLYPKASKMLEILKGYTGYISDSWINKWNKVKNHDERRIDVSYRTHQYGANRCYLRNLKYAIADRFQAAIRTIDSGLVIDIDNKKSAMIPGEKWHDFLENSKFCLTTPSGSSLLDPFGDYKKCSDSFSFTRPSASFQEVEEHCFPNIDRERYFSAISPRNIEAALAQTVQIATPGPYSGLLRPMQHYIPLEEDCSNIAEVVNIMRDPTLVSKIRQECKKVVLSEPRLRMRVIVDEIISFAESVVADRGIVIQNQVLIDRMFQKYHASIQEIAEHVWRRRRVKNKLRLIATAFGARRVKRLFKRILGGLLPLA